MAKFLEYFANIGIYFMLLGRGQTETRMNQPTENPTEISKPMKLGFHKNLKELET